MKQGRTTESLEEYRSKRQFSRTPEPAGEVTASTGGSRFVVQKHAASHLHYDFRLQLHGALKSWAIPKGPSLDPSIRRLANPTEDHPLEYADFEGVIPPGEYGAGTVLIWDSGEWEPLDEGKQGYYRGRLRFILHGQRLRGIWSLTRESDDPLQWYLVKEPDEYATSRDVLEQETSVVTGRTLDEISAAQDAKWTREAGLVEAPTFGHPPQGKVAAFVAPQAATLVDSVPEGEEWFHELKYDGYRIVCRIDKEGSGIRFFTRKRIDFTSRLKTLQEAVARLPVSKAWLDGEIVVLTPDGRSDFNALQNAFTSREEHLIVYLVFDLMNFEGYDIRAAPLSERKALLKDLVPQMERIRYLDHVVGQGREFYRQACSRNLEGIVSKRANSEYVSERSSHWLKIKCCRRQEFVIGAYTESGVGLLFGSLLAGYFKDSGEFVFCGKVKTGYSRDIRRSLLQEMQPLEQPDPAFINPPHGVEYRNPHWLKPQLVAEVEYTEITGKSGLLRHASFKGLRRDKDAREVTLEVPVPVAEVGQTRPKESPIFPRERYTRDDVRNYYSTVAEKMLPHLADRPLTLIVCPTNIYACKFTKHATNVPPPVKAVDAGHEETYIAVDSVEGLLTLVDLGTIEFHGWQSRYTKLEFPDRLLFDLDPPDEDFEWERLGEAALLLRLHLQDYGLESFLQTSGGKGYYVVVPLVPDKEWKVVTGFARRVAEEMEELYSDRFTAKMEKNERQGRIYVDWMRNGRGANAAEPYSLRARPGAPVATPITWEELVEGVRPDTFNLSNIGDRLRLIVEPWVGFVGAGTVQTLAGVRRGSVGGRKLGAKGVQ